MTILLAIGCDDSQAAPAQGASRFVAVEADPTRGHRPETFCDGQPRKALEVPELEGGVLPSGKPLWVNVWATWCKPCVEEIPLILGLRREMRSSGVPAELALISADARPEDVSAYRQKHSDMPASLRFREPADMHALFQSAGLDAAAPIPVHIFVDGQGQARCVRSGAVAEEHKDVIRGLLAGR